jgi:hypothetical protein
MLRILLIVISVWATTPAFLWAGPSLPRASAQTDAVQQRELARRLFNEGVALAEAERWAQALTAFRRSADLVARPSTLYNIANALYRLDRPVEGLQELDRYQAMPEVLSNLRDRERGVDLRNLLERAVGHLRLTITPASAEVFIDGKLCAETGLERDVLLDPGSHSIRVTHRGYETNSREIEVERGGQHAEAIALTPRRRAEPRASALPRPASSSIDPYPTSSPSAEPAQKDSKRFVKRPGFWVMIGSIAAVGIGAGVTAALLKKGDTLECGTTQACATTRGLSVFSF